MSQFRSTGGLDDAIAEDGDRGFFGVNQRLQLNQLKAGEVRESLNGRMEGYWKPRKVVVSRTGALTVGGDPLQLPFHMFAVTRTISAATISSGTVTITTSTAHGFSTGDLVSIQNIPFSVTNPNGRFQITLVSGTQFTYVAAGSGAGTYIVTASSVAHGLSKTIAAVSYLSDLVTLTVTGHGITVGEVGNATINGINFTGTNYNGVVPLTAATVNTLTFPTSGVTAVSIGTNPRVTQILIDDSANANVRASCLFSDPNTNNKEFVIVALDTVAKKIDLAAVESNSAYVPENIAYPAGTALGADTDMIQVFDKVMLFREGQQALEWHPNGRPILSASQSGTTVTMSVREHGLVAGTSVVIAGLTGGTPANGTFTVLSGAGLTQDQFQYTFTTSQTQTFVVTAATMTGGFTFSPGGAYTQPQVFNSSGNQVSVSNGEVSLNLGVSNNTVFAGDVIRVYESTIPEFSAIVGQEFQVSSATTANIKFFAPVANLTASGSTGQIEFGGRFSEGGGFMHQPGAPWGIHFQRRLWVPYYYDQSGDYNAVTYTDRKITDEIAVSDILDTTTFDQIENQFRISGGTADYVVGMHGFYDDALIVLNRNSIHQIKGTQGTLLDTKVTELTSEVGCLARKSVVMRANTMMFLSDDGVYGVEFLNDYNLRGAEEPISKNIQPYIDRLNKDLSNKSVGILFDNRYYLAVPLDSAPGINDARGNNSILVYNFLNGGWESLDTFGDTRFLIEDLIIGSAGVRNNLYAVTANGGLHQLEAFDDSNDTISVSNTNNVKTSAPILSRLITRGYDLETLERKRYTDAQINMQGLPSQKSEYLIEFSTEDPDTYEQINPKSIQDVGTTTQFLGGEILSASSDAPNAAETASIRCRLGGIRGYTGTMILTRTQGSAKINSIKVAGSVTNRQIISQK
jgi:hypothetical protein